MDSQILALNNGMIDLWRAKIVRADGTEDELTHLEVGLIRYLAHRPGQPVPRQELLAEVWGYGKAVRTRAVDATVKRLRHKIERDPSKPEHLRSAHGVGYAFFPASSPQPQADGSSSTPGGDVLEAVTQYRLVSMIGPIAVGKSHLARQVVGRLGGRVVSVDLETYTTREHIHSAIRAHAQAAPSDDPHWLAALGPVTLLLDNADADPVRDIVRDALASAPNARFLITRRRPLDLPAEQIVVVAPLSTEAGAALFQSEVQRMGRQVENSEAVLSIVEDLDRLPGFIRMAARRTTVQSEVELANMLQSADTWLVTDETPVPVQRAFRRMGDDTLAVLSALCTFTDTFSLAAAASVADLELDAMLAVLNRLVRAQWVFAEVGTPTHYRLLRVARALVEPPSEPVRERYAAWVARQAIHGTAQATDVARAAQWSTGSRRLALALCEDQLDAETGLSADRIARLQAHLARAGDAPAEDRLPVVRRIALLMGTRGDHTLAARWFDQALTVARQATSDHDIAEINISLSSAYRMTGRTDAARTAALEGFELASAQGNAVAVGVAAWSLGALSRSEGDNQEARRWFLKAIESGTSRGRGMALESLAILIRRELHTIAQPEQFFQRATAELMQAGDPAASAHASGNLGCLYIDAERLSDARTAFDYTLTTGRRLGLTSSVAFGTAGLSLCDALQGRRLSVSEPPEFASPLARVCHHIAQAIEANTAGHPSKTVGELAMAEKHASGSTRVGFRLARAVASAPFAPELALELVHAPAEGLLFDALQPVALALVQGEPSEAKVTAAQNALRGPDRAVLGATTLDLISRGIR